MTEPLTFPRRLTADEAAKILGFSTDTLSRLERAGRIKSFRPSPRKVYYLEPDLLAYMEAPKPWDREKKFSASASISSGSDTTARSGAHAGTTTLPDKQSALLSAQQTFQKRK